MESLLLLLRTIDELASEMSPLTVGIAEEKEEEESGRNSRSRLTIAYFSLRLSIYYSIIMPSFFVITPTSLLSALLGR